LQSNAVKVRVKIISTFKYKIGMIRENAHPLLNNNIETRDKQME
jgi:hypothetical protein